MATLADLNNLLHAVSTRVAPGFSLDIYFQMVHTTIGRYETPSLHTAIEMLSGMPGSCCGQDLGSDPNGAAIIQMVQNHPVKA